MLQLTFEVIDSGRITVSMLPNNKVAEITGELAGFVSADWNSDALDLLSPRGVDFERTTLGIAKCYLPIHTTQEILRQMRSLGHGGTIIFTSDNELWKKHVDRPVF
jgi:hypothetical protein